MRYGFPTVLGAALLIGLAGAQATGQEAAPFDRALAMYRQNELEDALRLFEAAARSRRNDPEITAYLAETLRRLGHHEAAVKRARETLARAPCHAFAHTVLGVAHSPQQSHWEHTDADSMWTHLLAAVECDESFGEAWLALVFEAMRRGEEAIEDRALRRLIETGFLTPSTLAFNRWVLASLPDSALLVTHGDFDTYPPLALQVVERLRPDVAVVNIALIGLPWYVSVTGERYGIPFPELDADLLVAVDRVDVDRLAAALREQSVRGELGRPLHAAVTLPVSGFAGSSGAWQLVGPSQRLVPGEDPVPVDTASVRRALEALTPADLAGPTTSPDDRSPVRISSGNTYASAAYYVGMLYAYAMLDSGNLQEAEKAADWVDEILSETGSTDVQPFVDELRQEIADRDPG